MKTLIGTETVKQLVSTLQDRKFRHWQQPKSLKEKIQEVFNDAGFFTWFEMETFLARCFRFGLNPLPQLRRLVNPDDGRKLEEVCSVMYHKAGSKSPWISRDALICTWDEELQTVQLEIMEHKQYEAAKPHLMKLDRLATIIQDVSREREIERTATMAALQDQAPSNKEQLVF